MLQSFTLRICSVKRRRLRARFYVLEEKEEQKINKNYRACPLIELPLGQDFSNVKLSGDWKMSDELDFFFQLIFFLKESLSVWKR